MDNSIITDNEIESVIPILQKVLWNKDARKKIQNFGINISPANFYSDIPSIEEIEDFFNNPKSKMPYFNSKVFNEQLLKENLEKLIYFSDEFNPVIEEVDAKGKYFWNNTQFSFSDAMSYYCFIRMIKPSNIVEIGSGFSTLITIEATNYNNNNCSIDCIEPFPRNFLVDNDQINLHNIKAQDLEINFLNDTLRDGDILFIDSTHTVKNGSDCLSIYLNLLPQIKHNIYVHVHDVFLPFALPKEWQIEHQIFWTEQYLLLAFLIDNPKASVIYGSAINAELFPEIMNKMMNEKALSGGSSIWFKYNGKENIK